MTLFDLCPGSEFELEGEHYTVTRLEGDKVWCVKEDGTVVPLRGYFPINETRTSYRVEEKRRSFKSWFAPLKAVLP